MATTTAMLPLGATRDLRVRLPGPRCAAGEEPGRGTVRAGDQEVTSR